MNSFKILMSILFLSLNFLSSTETIIKIKTKPDFPKGLPPQSIIWNGNEVGTTNPGNSVSISLDLTKSKGNLTIGETAILLWKSGMGIKGEVLSGKAKMKEGPSLVIKSKLSPEEILLNTIEYFPIIKEKLDSEIPPDQKILYSRLLANVLNYEFLTENIVSTITGMDIENDLVYLNFSYYGSEEISWNDTLKLTGERFSGKKPKKGSRAQVFSDHFGSIRKYGILKMNQDGEMTLTAVKTDKYKWGTYKKKKKKKKKHILPISFYVR
ncbi:MAG: hypothetical protein ACE5D0_00815 [Fidelibacterota bacterium]